MTLQLRPENALSFWEQAAQAEIGIAITLGDPAVIRSAQADLYRAREGREDLKAIRIVLPKSGNELWLVKDTVDRLMD